MNILVTGANGQLGTAMRAVSASATDHYIFTDIDTLDITSPRAIQAMVRGNDIDVIVNCAAYTNVDKAEDDAALARLLNATAPGYLARAMAERGGFMIHISTDYVFGGAQGNTPRTESEPTNPTGVYGLTKLEGEEAIAATGAKHIILRTAWLYSEIGKNFVRTMMDLTSRLERLKVVFDQCGTPTYASDLAKAIVGIISNRQLEGYEGIYHFSNEGVISWYDFAKAIAAMCGNDKCDIQPCHSDEFPSKVVRPAYSVLDKTKFKTVFGQAIPYWATSLAICINNLLHNEA